MLVAFPIALYVATLVALVAHGVGDDPFWSRAARIASGAGLVAALVTAIPGAIDLVAVVPRGRARRTGALHATANLIALAAIALCYAAIVIEPAAWIGWAIALAGIGVAATLVAGFLGWTLVQAHHIGVEEPAEEPAIEPPETRAPAIPPSLHAHGEESPEENLTRREDTRPSAGR
jgi:uncharacterized membrane protein